MARSRVLVFVAMSVLSSSASAGRGRPRPPPAPPPPAAPSDDPRTQAARETLTRGVELYEKGQISQAEEQLRLATQLAPGKPKPFYYLARVLIDLGRCPEALANLDIYFRLSAADHENRSHAGDLKTRCENEIARKGGTLLVESTPDTVEVIIDDENAIPAGVTPFGTERLSPGPHLVVMKKPGFAKAFRTVTIVPGQIVRLIITLDPENAASPPVATEHRPGPAPAPPATPAAPAAPAPAKPPVEAAAPPKAPEPEKPSSPALVPAFAAEPETPPPSGPSSRQKTFRATGIALLVVGVVGGAGGSVAGWYLGRDSDLRDGASIREKVTGATAATGSPYQTIMISSIAAGSVLAATGILFIGLSTRRERGGEKSKTAMVPLVFPTSDGAVAGVCGTFP